MNKQDAIQITGGLSKPSKMPGHGYGLPAKDAPWVPKLLGDQTPPVYGCPTGKRLAQEEGTTCSKCYATRNFYSYNNVRLAQARRLVGISHPDWVDAMIFLINDSKDRYFRWHDSGDIVNYPYLLKINKVSKGTPLVTHYLPTREVEFYTRFIKEEFVSPNLVIRISMPKINQPPAGRYPLTSTTHTKDSKMDYECPAYKQDNNCGNCRACWDKKVPNISYGMH